MIQVHTHYNPAVFFESEKNLWNVITRWYKSQKIPFNHTVLKELCQEVFNRLRRNPDVITHFSQIQIAGLCILLGDHSISLPTIEKEFVPFDEAKEIARHLNMYPALLLRELLTQNKQLS